MKQGVFEILKNRPLARDTYELMLTGDTSAITAPGQFVNLRLEGFYLRRPISVCDWEDGTLTLIYKVLGKGTARMTALPVGTRLDLLTGLGNGFDVHRPSRKPLLVGGGVGTPPVYGLARRLLALGKTPAVVLGFNTAEDVFYLDEFRALGLEPVVTTADGSMGLFGFVTRGMEGLSCDDLYTCGPERMLRAVYDVCITPGQFSFEERMGCGFGACMGCTCETKYGAKRICRDGPVLEKEEIRW